MADWFQQLRQQYETKIRHSGIWDYPKSHWMGCSYGSRHASHRIELPATAPADFISCNACLIREGYIRILPCNPRKIGWPHSWVKCDTCDYGNDCETWARVRGAGSQVQDVLRQLDPDAYHPVTWMDAGLVPFCDDGDLFFPTKTDLDGFMSDLTERYPGHFADPNPQSCYCFPTREFGQELRDQDKAYDDGPTTELGTEDCTVPHCIGFKADFGFFPSSHDAHTP